MDRLLLGVICCFSLLVVAAPDDFSMQSADLRDGQTISRIAFGSCFKQQRKDNNIWDVIRAEQPDLFVYAGDAVYADKENEQEGLPYLRRAYQNLSELAPFARFRQAIPVLSVWDDHDYGMQDGDASFSQRLTTEAIFESAWALDLDDPRRSREGIYHSRMLGPEGKRVQLILLDTRYFRSQLKDSDDPGAKGNERYMPDASADKTMLGEQQWSWLEEELRRPADIRLIVSSVQVLADGHGWESWRMLPLERDRLLGLIRDNASAPVYLLSGDRHVAGFYQRDIGTASPLLEFTSSPLNNTIPFPWRRNALGEAGPHRIGELYGESNFGTVDIDWEEGVIIMSLWSRDGEKIRELARQFR